MADSFAGPVGPATDAWDGVPRLLHLVKARRFEAGRHFQLYLTILQVE